MGLFLPYDDPELRSAFGTILTIENFSDYTNEIVELLYRGELSRANLRELLFEHRLSNIRDIKEEMLDVLLVYINLVLNDNVITENEIRNVKLLKRIFKIKEGDFYKYRYDEVSDVLGRQLARLYSDKRIDDAEALFKVGLQELFDLSYDQFLEFANVSDYEAIQKGAELTDLDTVLNDSPIASGDKELDNRLISQAVKDLVWNRDNGRCARCSSAENLDFGHVIPLSKGGSNTMRNVQVLCATCNE